MTVPALNTAIIGLLAYYENVHVPDEYWKLEDFLPYMDSFEQHPDYVDGVYTYGERYKIRIRTDKVIIVYALRDPTVDCGEGKDWSVVYQGEEPKKYHLKSYNIPNSGAFLYPVKAIEQLWGQVGYNAYVAPEYQFAYDDVKVYDYEYPTCTSIYVLGDSKAVWEAHEYFYYTVSDVSAELLSNFHSKSEDPTNYFAVNGVTVMSGISGDRWGDLEGITYAAGTQNTCHIWNRKHHTWANLIVYLVD